MGPSAEPRVPTSISCGISQDVNSLKLLCVSPPKKQVSGLTLKETSSWYTLTAPPKILSLNSFLKDSLRNPFDVKSKPRA